MLFAYRWLGLLFTKGRLRTDKHDVWLCP